MRPCECGMIKLVNAYERSEKVINADPNYHFVQIFLLFKNLYVVT